MTGKVTLLGTITYDDLMMAHRHRQELWNGVNPDGTVKHKGLLFSAVELAGETGELMNVIKKLEREKMGLAGSRATQQDFADELGDVIICAFMLADIAGIDPMKAAAAKFNKTSRKLGFPVEVFET